MALDSMKEIFDRMEQEGKPFWEIVLETEQGMLMIRGNELHVNRLTLDKGEVDIDGRIDSFVYSDTAASGEKQESLLTRLFR